MAKYSKDDVRIRIHRRIRHKVRGTEERPRLAVFRSLKHIYAQVIDDKRGHTMVAASSGEKDAGASNGGSVAGAKHIRKVIAEPAKAKGVPKVEYARGAYTLQWR